MTNQTAAEQKIAEAATAYKMKHFGRTDVDMFGRPFLTRAQVQEIRETKNRAPSRAHLTATSQKRIIWQREVA